MVTQNTLFQTWLNFELFRSLITWRVCCIICFRYEYFIWSIQILMNFSNWFIKLWNHEFHYSLLWNFDTIHWSFIKLMNDCITLMKYFIALRFMNMFMTSNSMNMIESVFLGSADYDFKKPPVLGPQVCFNRSFSAPVRTSALRSHS